jgi:prolyl 4-hydroxylase
LIDMYRRQPGGPTAVVTVDGGARPLPNTVRSHLKRLTGNETMDPLILDIHQRIADATGIPIENGEEFIILRYQPGQYFAAHLDAHAKSGRPTSTRHATFFTYLNDGFDGGHTFFPLAERDRPDAVPDSCRGYEAKNYRRQTKEERSSYIDGSETLPVYDAQAAAKTGLSVQPKQGHALFWHNLHPNQTIDLHSRHVGCPVLSGEKFALTKWMYLHHFVDRDDGIVRLLPPDPDQSSSLG